MGCFVTNSSNAKILPENRRHSRPVNVSERDIVKSENLIMKRTNKVTDNYKVLNKLGAGAFGSVYRIIDLSSKIIRAMKIIKKETIDFQDDERTFLKEIEILSKMDHPNIVKIFEYYLDDHNFYVISEYVSGGELYDTISSWSDFNENKVAFIFNQIMSAVFYLHSSNIVHRDLKPENIMVESGNNNQKIRIKLIDFGTCNYLEPGQRLKMLVGTPYYIAPEVLSRDYGQKCDIWSCGVILFVLLSGRPPFDGTDTDEIFSKIKKGKIDVDSSEWADISEEAKNLVKRMLYLNESKRPTAEEILADPWFKHNIKVEELDTGELKSALLNMRNFKSQEKLQKTAIAYIVHFFSTSADVEHLRKVFLSLDKNGDGRLTYEELMDGFTECFGQNFTSIEFYKLIEQIDQDKDGYISYQEFLRVTMDKQHLLDEEKLKLAFKQFDINGDGTLSTEELKKILGTSDNDLIKEILNNVDENNDGEISFKEFSALMRRVLEKSMMKASTMNVSKPNKLSHVHTIKEASKRMTLNNAKRLITVFARADDK